MATLVAIAYPDEKTAEQARATVWQLLEEELITQADQIAVISRNQEGKYHVHTSTPASQPRAERSGAGSGACCCDGVPDPVCRLGDGRRSRSAVRPLARQGHRSRLPAAGTRLRAAGHLGAVHGDRPCDAGQGDRRTATVRRHHDQRPRFPTRTPKGCGKPYRPRRRRHWFVNGSLGET